MKYRSIFWPLALVAVGLMWLLVSMGIVPASNVWALAHLFPYLLVALGVGLILRGRWQTAGIIVSTLVVVAALAAVVFAPQLGWAFPPMWGFGPGIANVGGGVAGSGEIEAETRQADGFTNISLNYPAEVTILQGESESITIEADDNLLPQLSAEAAAGTLVIQNVEEQWIKRVEPSQAVNITITVKDLREVDFSTAGTLRIESLNVEELSLDLNGAGDITIADLDAQRLAATLNGAGNITASGEVGEVSVRINGFGSFYGDELQSLKAVARINGAGSVNIKVEEHLTATINGAGSVGYYGSPEIERNINGAGSVTQLGK